MAETDTVARVLDALRNVPDHEVPGVLAKAEARRSELSVSEYRSALEALFNRQLKTLADRGCPDVLHEDLVSLRDIVVSKALGLTNREGNLPFVLVVPPPFLSYHTLASMLRNGSNTGYTRLNVRLITDMIEVPQEPYVIYDVEDGRALRSESPENATKFITQQHRSGLTAAEVLNLGIQTDVLRHHFVDAMSSLYGSEVVPGLWLHSERPGLHWRRRDVALSKWGAASCGSR